MYLKRESNLTEKLCQHYRQGSVQVLHQQVFPDLGPPPPASIEPIEPKCLSSRPLCLPVELRGNLPAP